ncbi:MAG: ABC transporter ATP-binding protein [Candidatus Omnitrophica bacterium]|nr:ABC transporter ATP-binding protein [Candidatus Omnitrophota bacterium]
MDSLLSVKNLTVAVGLKAVVNDVSFDVFGAQIMAVAGGSGSGKTTIGLSILRLLPPALRIGQGSIIFEGKNLLDLSAEDMRLCRGARIGMVFQEPLSAFDPLFTIGQQLEEVLAAHTQLTKQDRQRKVLEILSDVELPDPLRAYASYPHQLSGGMRQRAMMAQAMVCDPSLIIADEPTSSLDVTLQVKMMELFVHLKKKKNISFVLIAHDLGMISQVADEIIILREGKMVEGGKVDQVMGCPQNEYTKQLIEAFQ